ncbi:hypothetical protein [Microcoleus sp. herbarium2]|uniref:hypothetical protein n=1 Tax=Microcoleus sp. herbarium2 TaxID=3055433 RepID=UPI002FD0726B
MSKRTIATPLARLLSCERGLRDKCDRENFIMLELSQLLFTENAGDRQSRSSQQPEKPSYSHPNLLLHQLVIVNGKLFS